MFVACSGFSGNLKTTLLDIVNFDIDTKTVEQPASVQSEDSKV